MSDIDTVREALNNALTCTPDIGKSRYREALTALQSIEEENKRLREAVRDLESTLRTVYFNAFNIPATPENLRVLKEHAATIAAAGEKE